jgi:hypothetical protein
MRTGETVTDLGLYATECCSEEVVFDTGDVFMKCPKCQKLCLWDEEEEIVSLDEFEHLNAAAA